MTFEEELLDKIKQEIAELDPAILEILKKGMYEGEKKDDGSGVAKGIDKIQLDAAKAAAVILQEYIAHIIGRPVTRTELSGKNGQPLHLNIQFQVEKTDNIDNKTDNISDGDKGNENNENNKNNENNGNNGNLNGDN